MIRIGLILRTANGYILETSTKEPNSFICHELKDLQTIVASAERVILGELNPPAAGPADQQRSLQEVAVDFPPLP